MAICVGTVTDAWGFAPANGPRPTHTIAAAERNVKMCFVSVNHNTNGVTVYAQADGCTFDPTTMIQNKTRNGRTVVAFEACCVDAGEDNGVLTSGGPCTVAAGVVHSHMLVEDLATEKGNGAWAAASTWTKDVVYVVKYTEST